MKRITVSTTSLEVTAFVIASMYFFTNGHWLSGLICVTFFIFISDHSVKESAKEQETTLAADKHVSDQDKVECMSPYEHAAARKAFLAGVDWQKERP